MTDRNTTHNALVSEAAARLAWYDAGYDMALAYERAHETQCFFTGQGDTVWPAFHRAEETFTAAANHLATFEAEI